MFSADQIADIQGFNKVYQNLLKQIDSAILKTGYTLTEKDVLLEKVALFVEERWKIELKI